MFKEDNPPRKFAWEEKSFWGMCWWRVCKIFYTISHYVMESFASSQHFNWIIHSANLPNFKPVRTTPQNSPWGTLVAKAFVVGTFSTAKLSKVPLEKSLGIFQGNFNKISWDTSLWRDCMKKGCGLILKYTVCFLLTPSYIKYKVLCCYFPTVFNSMTEIKLF